MSAPRRTLDFQDKRRLIPWLALSAFGLGLAAGFLPLDLPFVRVRVAWNIASLVHGLVWFSYFHWHSEYPGESVRREFLENLLLPLATGLLPAGLGAFLASKLL